MDSGNFLKTWFVRMANVSVWILGEQGVILLKIPAIHLFVLKVKDLCLSSSQTTFLVLNFCISVLVYYL